MTLLVVGGGGLYFGTLYVLACGCMKSGCGLQGLSRPRRRLDAPVPDMELIRGIHNLRERHRGCVVTIATTTASIAATST